MSSNNVGAELSATLKLIRDRAVTKAPVAAANEAAKHGEVLVRAFLSRTSHAPGTPTPSPPGSPPAKISGRLARSVQRTPAVTMAAGVAVTTWGPTVIYGPVQEFGAVISARRSPVLANYATGQVFGTQVTIPARPYMKPATEFGISSGIFSQVQSAAFLAALGLN